ncbi:MAG: FAD-dependent oxidoreductase [Mycoplasmoidaceae bacterium]|nr:FAD-dependent oxidoreductase [Mycoplasmoidaceae bacterium]
MSQIAKNPCLTLLETEIRELIIKNKKVVGVKTQDKNLYCKKVIITTGTYMKAITHIGDIKQEEGPSHHRRSETLSGQLEKLGFKIIRLKTGTPPRIYKDSIDYDKMSIELGTKDKLSFSHFDQRFVPLKKQQVCYLTYTNAKTHEIINKNIHKSAMYSGQISGVGPRYCPSIEDKIVRFANKPRHQIFIEPESLSLDTMYLQGLSTSLPKDVQEKLVHSIAGLEKAKFKKYAYAIEYDAIDARDL